MRKYILSVLALTSLLFTASGCIIPGSCEPYGQCGELTGHEDDLQTSSSHSYASPTDKFDYDLSIGDQSCHSGLAVGSEVELELTGSDFDDFSIDNYSERTIELIDVDHFAGTATVEIKQPGLVEIEATVERDYESRDIDISWEEQAHRPDYAELGLVDKPALSQVAVLSGSTVELSHDLYRDRRDECPLAGQLDNAVRVVSGDGYVEDAETGESHDLLAHVSETAQQLSLRSDYDARFELEVFADPDISSISISKSPNCDDCSTVRQYDLTPYVELPSGGELPLDKTHEIPTIEVEEFARDTCSAHGVLRGSMSESGRGLGRPAIEINWFDTQSFSDCSFDVRLGNFERHVRISYEERGAEDDRHW